MFDGTFIAQIYYLQYYILVLPVKSQIPYGICKRMFSTFGGRDFLHIVVQLLAKLCHFWVIYLNSDIALFQIEKLKSHKISNSVSNIIFFNLLYVLCIFWRLQEQLKVFSFKYIPQIYFNPKTISTSTQEVLTNVKYRYQSSGFYWCGHILNCFMWLPHLQRTKHAFLMHFYI